MYNKQDVLKVLANCASQLREMRYEEEYHEQAELALETILEARRGILELPDATVFCPRCGYQVQEEYLEPEGDMMPVGVGGVFAKVKRDAEIQARRPRKSDAICNHADGSSDEDNR